MEQSYNCVSVFFTDNPVEYLISDEYDIILNDICEEIEKQIRESSNVIAADPDLEKKLCEICEEVENK